ncbi:rhodanese-like domain-containing protein [Thauera linaloolentis]|uniref:Rhodanese-like protein n=1 Tax=Thauera linaloolentis (strain DSM 12138 / JCM 21573 / CCUG 41526 / CIP 105981 / IAM 15112 / NBRC 102519 / 47Lol) TaxID=1123367 RepID=N6ZCV5_THAL4|nr:rhodanese-like domain-containing protein [Thauera linaloolentis]ENO90019.1 rhodanese-like protein [Thauera linaloolentis 47Lol = DSM 12138]MCM8565302.1 rhodanese-like domain-containing protein [Thauera linaloolentis]
MKRLLIATALGFACLSAQAADMAISAEETYAKIRQAEPDVLFVDVRDPVEIMFVGFSDAVHANVPFMLVDRSRWNAEKGVFRLYQNPDFAAQIKAELEKRGMNADAEVITMCRSGSERGEPSAAFLRANGFPNARYVVNGFQGAAIKEGPQAGLRLQNGWQNSGLPWSPKMNPEKIHRIDPR